MTAPALRPAMSSVSTMSRHRCTALLLVVTATTAFRAAPRRSRTAPPTPRDAATLSHSRAAPLFGLFDAFAKAFQNEDFTRADRRVRARHVLAADRDPKRYCCATRSWAAPRSPTWRDVESCASASNGGDLGSFGPGKMVAEFDAALFPDFDEPPSPGALVDDRPAPVWVPPHSRRGPRGEQGPGRGASARND